MEIKNEGCVDEAEAAMSWAVEKVRQLYRSIQGATANEEEVWFRNLLLGILHCALLDYYSVDIGAKKSVYLAAWGRRNLLELKVITTYVLTSESNAVEFRNDLVIDAKEFYEALTKYHQASHNNLLAMMSELARQQEKPIKEILEQALRKETERGPETDATDAEAATYKQLMIDFGVKENARPMMASNIANKIQEKADFDPMNRICSKIMHRTVFSIASSITPGSLDATIPFLSSSSACDLLSIYGSINDHFNTRGIRPPEN